MCLGALAFWMRNGKWTLCQITHVRSTLCLCAYILDGNSKLQLCLEKHESSVNAVEDENSDSLITQAISDFVLPAGFPGDCRSGLQMNGRFGSGNSRSNSSYSNQ